MIMQYHKAPMHYVDGKAAYKSGEWAGLKSCKFGPTRRVIRAVSKESIFDNRILPIYGRKHFETIRSGEMEFKPCLKVGLHNLNRTQRSYSNKHRAEGIGMVKLDFSQNKDRPEKRHNFGYLERKNEEIKEKIKSIDTKTAIKNELNFFTQLGCAKKDYDKFLFNKIKLQSNHEDKKIITREKEKIEENQRLNDQEKILQKTALQHVNSLKDWEKTTLPKIGKV